MKSKLLRFFTVILVFVLALSFVAPVASARTTPFTDVPQGSWFHDAVAWAYGRGLVAGTSPTTFSPHDNITRGQFVVFLHRIVGSPRVGNTIRFHDVTPSQYFFDAVNWASDNRIVSGVGDGNFAPRRNLTRQEMAVILFNFAGFQDRNTSAPESALHRFPDRHNISTFAQEAMRWAAQTGMLRGCSRSGMINPRNPTTRAEVIAVIQRYVLNEPFTPPPLPPPPPPPGGSHSIQQAAGFPSLNRFPGREGWRPDMIVMHTTAGSAASAIHTSLNHHANIGNRTSYHFVICQRGTITQIVPITDGAWANGTRVNTGCSLDHRHSTSPTVRSRFTNANFYTVSIGFGDAGPTWEHTNGAITPQQISAGAWLLRHIRYEIWRLYGITIPIDRSTVIGHNEVTPRSTGTPPGGCPGPLFPFDTIINMAR